MVKKVTTNIFLTAFLILLILLIIIFFSITAYENYKKANYEENIKFLNQQMLIDDLYMSYISDTNNTSDKCEILEKQYSAEYEINRSLLEKLRQINKNALVPTSNYIKYTYVLTNVKLWLFSQKLNKECDKNKILVLYFYSETVKEGRLDKIKDDQLNGLFENTLTDLSERCENINIFAMPYNKEIIILNQILSDYNVNRYPAVVIDKEVYYSVAELKDYNCNN